MSRLNPRRPPLRAPERSAPAPEPALPLVLRVPQVAEILQISERMAYELVARGEIPAIRLGRSVRVSRDALLDWLQRQGRETSWATRPGGLSGPSAPGAASRRPTSGARTVPGR